MKPEQPRRARLGSVLLCLALGLAACGQGQEPPTNAPTPNVTQVYATVHAQLTLDAGTSPSSTPAPPVTDTPPPTPTQATTLTAPPPTPGLPAQNPSQTCDLAAAGNPIDVTIPDDTKLQPGQAFTKTWRLQNAGACTWSRAYSIGLFSGELMGAQPSVPLPQEAAPNQSLDITVDMVAPQAAGTYQGNWKLKNSLGNWFGIGPNGSSPFWVRIVVEPMPTATVTPITPTPSLTATSTPSVKATGSVTLRPGDKFDLDQASNQGGEDLSFETNSTGQHLLIPQGSVVMSAYGATQPVFVNCQTASMSAQPLIIETLQPNTYLCYRTNQGNPGWMLAGLTASDGTLRLDYLTWGQP